MNAEAEAALESYLAARLAGITGIAVHAGTKRETLPADRRTVICVAKDMGRRPVKERLYRPTVGVIVSTPVVGSLTVADHRALVKETLWAMQPVVDADHDSAAVAAAKAALDAAFITELALHCLSTRAEGPKEAHTQEEWVTVIDTLLCLTA